MSDAESRVAELRRLPVVELSRRLRGDLDCVVLKASAPRWAWLIHTSLRSPLAAARFEAERQAMARLSHPNVAQIYDAGTKVNHHDGSAIRSLSEARSPRQSAR